MKYQIEPLNSIFDTPLFINTLCFVNTFNLGLKKQPNTNNVNKISINVLFNAWSKCEQNGKILQVIYDMITVVPLQRQLHGSIYITLLFDMTFLI